MLAFMKQPPQSEDDAKQNKIWLQKVKNVILRHAGNNELKTADLAELLEMNKRTLERKLKKLIGKSPKQYLNEIRLQLAHQLIMDKKWKDTQQIAFAVGFEGRDHFSRIFKKHFGYSPSALIKLVATKENKGN